MAASTWLKDEGRRGPGRELESARNVFFPPNRTIRRLSTSDQSYLESGMTDLELPNPVSLPSTYVL